MIPFLNCFNFIIIPGVVVRLDDKIAGNPLYEIKLDAFPLTIAYVQMDNDVLHHYLSTTTALQGIEEKPVLKFKDYNRPFAVFGLHPDDPFYNRKNVTAAWTIQRAFRTHQSRNKVAKVRFEMWVRTAAVHSSLLSHLADSGSMTAQGLQLALTVGARPKKPIKVAAQYNSILPERLSAVIVAGAEVIAIRREFEDHVRTRGLKIMKAAAATGLPGDYFLPGYQPFTFSRKVQE